ncbi:MAG TPA: transposase [Kiritimatiellia bacterium]|mgnify:CR=1 FL=1|nr:transposase [Kiritimatiellia bacterium]
MPDGCSNPGNAKRPLGWYSRGYLPHADQAGIVQFITYHLADSQPADVVERLSLELATLPSSQQDLHRRKRIEEWMDAGYGSCLLRQPEMAAMLVENWRKYEGVRYELLAWVVMPNHAHVMIRLQEGMSLPKIVQAWKGYSGRKIAEFLRASGTAWNAPRIWHREYWDRFIRDARHFQNAMDYIHLNPVKAGLVASPEDWPWSSASSRKRPAFAGQ